MLEVSMREGIAEIELQRPPANAFNLAFVESLLNTHEETIKNGALAIVIKGKEGLFSAGLDVPELISQSRNSMLVFWGKFFDLMYALMASPIPTIAAVTGHAPAGGAVLALHCDYRIAAAGNFQIGLNEVQVGLVVPPPVMRVLQYTVGTRRAALMAISGQMFTMDEALQIGLVDELVPVDQVVERARTYAMELLKLPPVAMNATRMSARADLSELRPNKADIRLMTDYWFSDETQEKMRQLVSQLGK